MLDLLDYCHRSLTRLLVDCEEKKSGGGKVVESEESSEEDSDSDENKRKTLKVPCVCCLLYTSDAAEE